LTSQSAGGLTVSFTYDNNGNQLTMTDATGTTTRTYDALNRVVSKTAPATGTVSFVYDVTSGLPSGCAAERQTDGKGNAVTKAYDKNGRLAEVSDGNGITSYAYNSDGSLQKLTYPGGASEEYAYYADNRLKTLANKLADGTVIDAYNYSYDGAGNLLQTLDGKGLTEYGYDGLNRLASVSEPGKRQIIQRLEPALTEG